MPVAQQYSTLGEPDLLATPLAQWLATRAVPLCFSHVDFSGQNLARLDFSHCRFERCTFAEANLSAADFSATQWQSCRAGQANFRSARLDEAAFNQCDLNNTHWQRSKLAHARFDGCKLTGANFADSATLGLVFSDCVLRSACLAGMSFYKGQLHNLDFTEADLSYCDFRHAEFIQGGSLSLARVTQARFDGADLREASLHGLKLVDAKAFKGATISRAQATMLLAGLGLEVL